MCQINNYLSSFHSSINDSPVSSSSLRIIFSILTRNTLPVLTFFEKLSSSIKLVKLDDKTINFLANLKDSLEDYRVNNIISDELVDIKTLNIHNIINSIHFNDANPDEILKNIRASLKNININEGIDAITNIINTHENVENIIDEHEYMKILFEYSKDHLFDYDTDGKKYLLSYL